MMMLYKYPAKERRTIILTPPIAMIITRSPFSLQMKNIYFIEQYITQIANCWGFQMNLSHGS